MYPVQCQYGDHRDHETSPQPPRHRRGPPRRPRAPPLLPVWTSKFCLRRRRHLHLVTLAAGGWTDCASLQGPRFATDETRCLRHIAITDAVSTCAPHAGSGVVRIHPQRFLAGCRSRRLNQALSVLSLSLDCFQYVCCALLRCVICAFCLLVVLVRLSVYQCT